MYHYLPYTINNSKKTFNIDMMLSTSYYMLNKKDILDNIGRCKDMNGCLILDDFGLRQLNYLISLLDINNINEIGISIIEKLAKQVIII